MSASVSLFFTSSVPANAGVFLPSLIPAPGKVGGIGEAPDADKHREGDVVAGLPCATRARRRGRKGGMKRKEETGRARRRGRGRKANESMEEEKERQAEIPSRLHA